MSRVPGTYYVVMASVSGTDLDFTDEPVAALPEPVGTLPSTPTGPFSVVRVACEAGDVVTGGGFQALGTQVIASIPVPFDDPQAPPTEWAVTFTKPLVTESSHVVVFAVCLAR